MYISRLDWDDYRIDHIARHNVIPDEVWEVCGDPFHAARRQGLNRYLVYGQTAAGRPLFVVLEQYLRDRVQARHRAGYDSS